MEKLDLLLQEESDRIDRMINPRYHVNNYEYIYYLAFKAFRLFELGFDLSSISQFRFLFNISRELRVKLYTEYMRKRDIPFIGCA